MLLDCANVGTIRVWLSEKSTFFGWFFLRVCELAGLQHQNHPTSIAISGT